LDSRARRIFDAILLAGGAEQPRDLNAPGRELRGIHFAMDFLSRQNRRCAGDRVDSQEAILATGRRVVILGGGDAGCPFFFSASLVFRNDLLNISLIPFAKFLILSCHAGWK
jgi:NADPH-dependent glutamate synthase beta subunit-like oxidoreductase